MPLSNRARSFRGMSVTNDRLARPALRLVACLFAAGTGIAHASDDTRRPLTALEHGLRPTVLKAGESAPGWSLQERMAHHRVPGVAVALLKSGEVVQAAGFGVREAGTNDAVDADTLFSVGSISKMLTAAITLRLVAQGKLDLDRNVNDYLTKWRIPAAPSVPNPRVTLRMLMSHTSGLSVWGFEDYRPGEPLPSLLETLDGKRPAKNEPIRLAHEPGARMAYSGGGVMVEQLVLETVAGTRLESLARAQAFEPVGMPRSTFENPLPASRGNIAKAHDDKGARAALPRGWEAFPELAASGLWTSANDLGAFAGALLRSYRGADRFLPQALTVQMMTEVSPSWHGLGPRLDGAGEQRIFHHGGSNDSYRAWIEGHLDSGDGFVILTNGSNGGRLMLEIRNALSDALGHGVNPPIRSIALAPGSVALADYAGAYQLDAAVPIDVRARLTDSFATDLLQVKLNGDTLSLSDKPGAPARALLPLTPTRFVAHGDLLPPQFEFHRDTRGSVRGLSVERGASHAYYRRVAQ